MMNIHTVKIGMAQIFCLDGDREGNFTRIEYAIQEATEKGAQIVCFPEMAVLGWVNPEAHQRAFQFQEKIPNASVTCHDSTTFFAPSEWRKKIALSCITLPYCSTNRVTFS